MAGGDVKRRGDAKLRLGFAEIGSGPPHVKDCRVGRNGIEPGMRSCDSGVIVKPEGDVMVSSGTAPRPVMAMVVVTPGAHTNEFGGVVVMLIDS